MLIITWKSVNKKDINHTTIIKHFYEIDFMRNYLVDPADVGENNGIPVLVSKRLMKFFMIILLIQKVNFMKIMEN